MLRKMFIKHSLERGRTEWGFQSLYPSRREVWREVFTSLQTVSQSKFLPTKYLQKSSLDYPENGESLQNYYIDLVNQGEKLVYAKRSCYSNIR